MNFPALKDGNIQCSANIEYSVSSQRVGRSCQPVIAAKCNRREIARFRGLRGILVRTHRRGRRLKIRTRIVRKLHRVLEFHSREGFVRRLIGEFVLLPGCKPNDPRQRQFLNGQVVLCLNQFLLPRFQFYLRAQPVDRRRGAGLHLIRCLIVKSLRGIHLRGNAFDSRNVRDRQQIIVADREYHEIARILRGVLRGLEVLRRSPRLIQRLQIQHRLRHVSTRVVISKRSNQRRNRDPRKLEGKSKLSEVHLGSVDVTGSRHIWQQCAQLFPALPARRLHILAR